MKKIISLSTFLIICLLTAFLFMGTYRADSSEYNQPKVKPDGSKWRIAYCESENFITYPNTLTAIVYGLEELGWINNLDGFDQVADSGDSKLIWEWLSTRDVSPYIEFVEDAAYNLRDPDFNQTELIERLRTTRDIDLVVVMGAAAGNFLANADHDTNIFVFAASNAVRSGIIVSAEDSGKDNVWAHMDEQRFVRQTRAFYDIIRPKKVGMVYEDSDAARVYSAVHEMESLAEEKGFEIIRYYVKEPVSPEEFPAYYQEVQAAYNRLAGQVDAVYVTIASLESTKLPVLFTPFYEHKIPIFSQLGNIEVQNGALITVSVMDEINIGRFGADNVSRCLLGAKPRDLEQTFQSAPKITINAEVAKKIGFKLPFELAMVVDEVYKTIGGKE